MTGRGRPAGATNELLERMTQVLETLAHNQEAELTEYRGLSSFTRHNPPKFEEKFDPEGAQRWIADVEKIFHAMGCKEEQKGNYFPRDLKKQKAREFLKLKQGNMSVGEYVAKFHELMKYWPHYQHDDEEEDLCAQFKHGLRPDIRDPVSVFQLIDLPTLMSKCRIFEANTKGKTMDTRIGGPVRQDRRPPRFSRGP
ncbi:uncharacterized protein LOC113859894 [Abrus precatorius]|uniref:Uncharacterized protein LOC113859894 n=1 Tax=Abrus precatorius TaxID=3816 RepID=A0A8B8L146_ABRPR|nr:uncharacterized protein LOC113859894 [Abrus precatorius]